MLTECLPDSLTAAENSVRDLANYPVQDNPAHNLCNQHMVHKNVFSRGIPSEGSECVLKQDQEISLLLTDMEMRWVSPHKVQELKSIDLKTLTISVQNKDLSEAQLNERPVLIIFREGNTLKDTYRLLYSLLESSNPVPKPRLRSFHQHTQQQSLMEALRRGIETGDDVLTFQHADDVRIQQSNCDSKSSSSSQSRMTQEVRLSTYQRMDSLEETIRELENTLIEISSHPTRETLYTESATRSIPAQRTGSLMSETRRPPVPPKPASIQVHCLLLLLCTSVTLKQHALFSFFSADDYWNFSFKPLMSAP